MTVKLTDSTLRRSLEQEGCKQLYFFAGNDAFLMDRCVDRVAAAAGAEERVRLDFSAASSEEVAQQLASFSFAPKLLILDNFKASAFTEERRRLYGDYLPELPATLTVAVRLLAEEGRFSLPKAAEAFCDLCPNAALVSCLRKSGGELARYVDVLADRQGCRITDDACRELIRLCGDDLMQLGSEIQKLAGGCSYGTIDLPLVRALCPKTTEENVFDFVRAMERGQTAQAVLLLYEMMEQEAEPAMLLGAIATSFVNLCRCKVAKAANRSRRQLEEDLSYRRDDRALSVAFDRQSRYSEPQLLAILQHLAKLDLQLKSGGADRTILLEQGMVKLALLVSGRWAA